MVEEFKEKMAELEGPLFQQFKRLSSIDLPNVGEEDKVIKIERDFGMLEDLVYGYNQWKQHNKILLDNNEKEFGRFFTEYFKINSVSFELLLLDKLIEKVEGFTAQDFSHYINDLAKAVIMKRIEMRAFRLMIRLSSNQF